MLDGELEEHEDMSGLLASHRARCKTYKDSKDCTVVAVLQTPSLQHSQCSIAAMFALPLLTLAVSVTVGMVQAGPLLATISDVELAAASPTSPVSDIDIAQCLFEVQCCLQTIPVPSILPTEVSLPLPLPTLGPLIGLQCSSAFDIIGNKWYAPHATLLDSDLLIGTHSA